jgi:formate hydrogenlyase subunit 3/multisubunit Na+/H+ antiporter MnhD subunit
MNWDLYYKVIYNMGSRYMLAAAIAFVLFYFILYKWIGYKKIQPKKPHNADLAREIGFSAMTIAIAGFIIMFLHHPAIAPYTTRYQNISDHGWATIFYYSPCCSSCTTPIFISRTG